MAAVGWGFGNGFRAELQGDYLRAGLNNTNGGNGHQQAYGGFGNLLYDFDLGVIGAPGLSAYLGAGVGYQESKIDGSIGVGPGEQAHVSNGGIGDVAIQGIVGLAYNIAAVPGLAVTAEYHFIATPENLGYDATIEYGGAETRLNFKTDGLYSHTGLVGIRYALWQPAAAVQQAVVQTAPPPPAARYRSPHLPGVLRLGSG
jgi:OOP family OmpA-OmpF porin